MAVAAVQLAQRAFSGSSATDKDFHNLISAAINKLASLSWNRVNFPIANTLLSQTYADIFARHSVKDSERPQLLLESLFTFLNVLEMNPDLGEENMLRQIIEADAMTRTVAATPVELNYRANVLKIFNPANVTAVDLEPLNIVVYRGELIGGGFGPELWGLSYTHNNQAYVLLETGELVQLPETNLCLAASKDYSSTEVPPYLLACARLFFPVFLSQIGADKATISKLENNCGTFTTDSLIVFDANFSELTNCESVLDKARWTGHHAEDDGCIKTLDVPERNLQIVITAQQAAIRPYITSALVNSRTGIVLMRLDTPREFSAYGIYLYPAGDASAALICHPTV